MRMLTRMHLELDFRMHTEQPPQLLHTRTPLGPLSPTAEPPRPPLGLASSNARPHPLLLKTHGSLSMPHMLPPLPDQPPRALMMTQPLARCRPADPAGLLTQPSPEPVVRHSRTDPLHGAQDRQRRIREARGGPQGRSSSFSGPVQGFVARPEEFLSAGPGVTWVRA